MARIELKEVSFRIDRPGPSGEPFALEDVNLTIPNGQVMGLLGPSGSGKTTLLRLIAGLVRPDSGQILYNGRDMAGVPPNERHIGMVFQNYALYPHYTARDNILSFFRFTKKTPGLDEMEREKYRRTSDLMGVDIKYLLGRKPAQLSGGEKQKVAIARCITRDPKLFLMDEPFAHLDQKLRESYRIQVKRLLREFRVTTVYVTHDQQEVLALADQVALMRFGRVEQVDYPRRLYDRPRNLFVAEFLNFNHDTPAINLIDGVLVGPELAGYVVGIRPEDLVPVAEAAAQITGPVTQVRRRVPTREVVVTVKVGARPVSLYVPAPEAPAIGDVMSLRLEKYHLFDPASGRRITL